MRPTRAPPDRHAQRRAHDPIDNERFEQGGVFFQIDKVRIRQSVAFRLAACCPAQGEHSVLVRNQRVGANQNSFDPAKDGGICPDAERKTKDRENGEAGAAPEHAGTETKILQKIVRR